MSRLKSSIYKISDTPCSIKVREGPGNCRPYSFRRSKHRQLHTPTPLQGGIHTQEAQIRILYFRYDRCVLLWLINLTRAITDNYIKASPACKRAVLETVEALRKAGHECVEFEIPDCSYSAQMLKCLHSRKICSIHTLQPFRWNHLVRWIQDNAQSPWAG